MTVITTASAMGVAFVAGHEGRVLKAYRCPAGVVTIGYGFTMGSAVFAAWWRAKHGRALRLGDTMMAADANALLRPVLDEEYGKAVAAKIQPRKQQHYDGAGSMTFNCGIGALKWKWALALAAGDIAECARRLRATAVTANGKRLAGLVRRRAEEAAVIERGDYGAWAKDAAKFEGAGDTRDWPSTSTAAEDVRWYQEALIALKVWDGPADGIAASSDVAVHVFQMQHDLAPDGIVGPATRAALIRALDAQAAGRATGGATIGAGGVGGAGEAVSPDPTTGVPHVDLDWHALLTAGAWALAAFVIVAVGFALWRNRGALTGRRVPT